MRERADDRAETARLRLAEMTIKQLTVIPEIAVEQEEEEDAESVGS